MKVAAIIQARMGSTRLPGKALKKIQGKTILWHIINRVKHSKLIDYVIIACTIKNEDKAIEDFAKKNSIKVYRGNVNDIVDRFYNAAKIVDADIIVRLWGDCPLIDPKLIDDALKVFIDKKIDYLNNFNPPSYPSGLNFEIYSFETLYKILKNTKDAFFREYPFEYVYNNKQSFKTFYDKNKEDLSNIHLTVDYQQDFDLISVIFEKLLKRGKIFYLEDIIKLIKEKPELQMLNINLKRNIEYEQDLKKR